MRNNAIPQIEKSILIIRRNPSPIIVAIAASLFLLIPFAFKTTNILYYLFVAGVMFVIYPSIYGRYSEIILQGKFTSYSNIFKRHWANYIVISIILAVPLAFIELLKIFSDIEIKYFKEISSILISTIAIYILPLAFINGKAWKSVKLGLKCSLGNVLFNLPLFLIVFASTSINIFLKHPGNVHSQFTFLYFYIIFIPLNVFIEFLVFNSATMILKDKGLTEI